MTELMSANCMQLNDLFQFSYSASIKLRVDY